MPKIVISAGCQGGALQLTLQELFPGAEVQNAPMVDFHNAASMAQLGGQLADADHWLTIDGFDHFDAAPPNPRLQVVRTPQVWFSAFHPDMCYAQRASDKGRLQPDYNSAIGLFAWRLGLQPADAVRLFNAEVFEQLGYFGEWSRSVASLRWSFDRCGMSAQLDGYVRRLQRMGVFMHTLNHPRAPALVELGKLLAVRLGAPASVLEADIAIADGLAATGYWPIYPEVGHFLGVPSRGYVWRNTAGLFEGIPAYLEYMYGLFEQQGLARDDIEGMWRDTDHHLRVLRAHIGAS